MSGNLQLYTKADVYVNGAILAEEASVTITRNANSTSINTVALGYAGEMGGSSAAELEVTSAIPSSGFEMDPGKFIGVLQEVNFNIVAGNSYMSFNGFIISDNFSHSVNTQSNLSFKAKGVFGEWSRLFKV